jgi:transcriptional regulator with XRE-family HTH domain
MKEIGGLARATRKQKNLGSMREIASLLSVSRNDISEIELGKFTGSFRTVMNYLNFLGLTLVAKPKAMPTLDDLEGMFDDD